MMHVASKPANKSEGSDAESVERREGAEGNTSKDRMRRTPSRVSMLSGLERVRERAKAEKKERFTALLHHVDVDLLRTVFSWLKRDAAPGVDGMRWRQYEQNLEDSLVDLHARVHRGAYRAQHSRRKFIPKADGRERPLGIATVADRLLQKAVARILEAIFEADFCDVSYGYRPGRSPHHALHALREQITSRALIRSNSYECAAMRPAFGVSIGRRSRTMSLRPRSTMDGSARPQIHTY